MSRVAETLMPAGFKLFGARKSKRPAERPLGQCIAKRRKCGRMIGRAGKAPGAGPLPGPRAPGHAAGHGPRAAAGLAAGAGQIHPAVVGSGQLRPAVTRLDLAAHRPPGCDPSSRGSHGTDTRPGARRGPAAASLVSRPGLATGRVQVCRGPASPPAKG